MIKVYADGDDVIDSVLFENIDMIDVFGTRTKLDDTFTPTAEDFKHLAADLMECLIMAAIGVKCRN